MGDHQSGVPPIIEFLEEVLGRRRRLAAVGGKFADRYAGLTITETRGFRPVLHEFIPALGGRREGVEPHEKGRGRHIGYVGRTRGQAGTDRPSGDGIIVEVAQDHVLMTPMQVGGWSYLCPLPAEVGHHVGFRTHSTDRIAFPNRIDGFSPAPWAQCDRVVIDGPKIESRAMPGIIARVCHRVRPLTSGHGKTHLEGIERESGMDMEIAEENLLLHGNADLPCSCVLALSAALQGCASDAGALRRFRFRRSNEETSACCVDNRQK